MLCSIYWRHQDYGGGQDEVVHLRSSIAVATSVGAPWAFTDRHAEVGHALFFDDLADLDQVPWAVMPLRRWSGPGVDMATKEKRQAEFLVHQRFPWAAIDEIACLPDAVAARAAVAVRGSRPLLTVKPQWYY